jgi:hypothetical protein
MARSLRGWRSVVKWRVAAPVPPEPAAAARGCSTVPAPDELVRTARPGHSAVGWKLDRAQRAELLERLGAAYGNVVADHVWRPLPEPIPLRLAPARWP